MKEGTNSIKEIEKELFVFDEEGERREKMKKILSRRTRAE
jgi:hypothetical protein